MQALAIALVFVLPLAAAKILSPKWLRWTAAWLMTRADVIEAQRQTRDQRMKHWMTEFGAE